ncbi:MAG: CRISPR-associated protein Cas4 [Thermoplasmata archaeon]
METKHKNETINASEIGQYEYCSVSWELLRQGHKPISKKLEVGTAMHVEVGKKSTDEVVQSKYNILEAKIIYTDLDKPAKPLFSKRFKVSGKPDYIVKSRDRYIPIELKSTVADKPYKSHILQLAAYCLLIEEEFNTAVEFGIIEYANGSQYRVSYDIPLKFELRKTLAVMRDHLKKGTVERNHNSPNRCKMCSFRNVCKNAITEE